MQAKFFRRLLGKNLINQEPSGVKKIGLTQNWTHRVMKSKTINEITGNDKKQQSRYN